MKCSIVKYCIIGRRSEMVGDKVGKGEVYDVF